MTLHQSTIFDLPPKPIEVNASVAPCDRKRLSRQCSKLLAALRVGPMCNVDLMAHHRIFNLSARCSELRKAGCVVVAKRTDQPGVFEYTLESCPDGLGGEE